MTFPEAWLALYDLLCADRESNAPVTELDSVENVYLGEPPAGAANGVIWVSIVPETLGASDHQFRVRVYVNLDTDVFDAQLAWAGAVEQVESVFSAEWARADWTFGFDAQLNRLVASVVVGINRP